MFYCKYMDLPLIPEELIDENNPGVLFRYNESRLHTINSNEVISAPGPYHYATPELTNWVIENICSPNNLDYTMVGFKFQLGNPDQHTAGPHSDFVRDYTLIYSVRPAGGKIVYWQELGFPERRHGRQFATDFSKLTKIAEFDTPEKTWYLTDSRVLHSVEELTGVRINIQVGLKSIPEHWM